MPTTRNWSTFAPDSAIDYPSGAVYAELVVAASSESINNEPFESQWWKLDAEQASGSKRERELEVQSYDESAILISKLGARQVASEASNIS